MRKERSSDLNLARNLGSYPSSACVGRTGGTVCWVLGRAAGFDDIFTANVVIRFIVFWKLSE